MPGVAAHVLDGSLQHSDGGDKLLFGDSLHPLFLQHLLYPRGAIELLGARISRAKDRPVFARPPPVRAESTASSITSVDSFGPIVRKRTARSTPPSGCSESWCRTHHPGWVTPIASSAPRVRVRIASPARAVQNPIGWLAGGCIACLFMHTTIKPQRKFRSTTSEVKFYICCVIARPIMRAASGNSPGFGPA